MKKTAWRILRLGLAGVASFAARGQWKLAHQGPVPEGIAFGRGPKGRGSKETGTNVLSISA